MLYIETIQGYSTLKLRFQFQAGEISSRRSYDVAGAPKLLALAKQSLRLPCRSAAVFLSGSAHPKGVAQL